MGCIGIERRWRSIDAGEEATRPPANGLDRPPRSGPGLGSEPGARVAMRGQPELNQRRDAA